MSTGGSAGAVGGGSGGVDETPGFYTPPHSAESCNGIDDDGDGNVDNLGAFTCGLGACERTVTACVAGVLQHCVAGTPASGPDGCDGIDNDCDGAVDEDCGACIHVAPDGDDTAAIASQGTSAFASVQAAIDFADAHRNVATQVCVAAGATCGLTAAFAGPSGADLQMADGIDVFANYESTTYTRCTDSTTHLAPQTAPGVVFGSDITHDTTLDGFSIDRSGLSGVTGVTVDGGKGARLTNLTITGGDGVAVDVSYGANIINGGDALVARSRIDRGNSAGGAAVRASGARVSIEDNCPTALDASGRCTSTCSSTGPELDAAVPTQGPYNRASVVELDDAPGSRIERSAVCAPYLVNDQDGIRVGGDAAGVGLRGNDIDTTAKTYGGNHSVALEDCAGASPWVVDNPLISMYMAGPGTFSAPVSSTLRAAGDCHPVIEENTILAPTNDSSAIAVHCDTANDVGSRCVVTHNPEVEADFGPGSISGGSFGAGPVVGVRCDGASCSRIDHNSITGFSGNVYCQRLGCGRAATALVLAPGAGTFVSSNVLAGANGFYLAYVTGTGVSAAGGGTRIENNVIIGVYGTPGYDGQGPINEPPSGIGFSGYADVSSNYITGSVPSGAVTAGCDSYGVVFAGGGTFRNNVITAGGCGASIVRSSDAQNPDAFEHNALYNGPVGSSGWGPLGALMLIGPYWYHPTTEQYLSAAADVDAVAGLNASASLGADCAVTSDFHLPAGSPCIDAGSNVGVPLVDRDGDARSDGKPDIGPDEVVH